MYACVRCVPLLFVCVRPLGFASVSIRVTRLEKNRWFSRVHNSALSWNAKCIRKGHHMLSVNMCVLVFMRASQICTLAKNGNFVWPHGRMAAVVPFSTREGPWVHAYVKKCVLSHWYSIALSSQWPNNPIMFVLGKQISFVPSRLAACWCSFQPAWMDYSIHFMVWTCTGVRYVEVWLVALPLNCFSVSHVCVSAVSETTG